MKPYQQQFIELAVACEALAFGHFTLKSGRASPYFFNAGRFASGASLWRLARCYAAALEDRGARYDVLFGPAYKGIPLVAATACALAAEFDRDVPWAYNRKEVKSHGEGGALVGAPLRGRVLIVDDVITAGTAVREARQLILSAGAEPAGVVIGLDRQERGAEGGSACAEVERILGAPVYSIIGLDELMAWLHRRGEREHLAAIESYRARYGA